MTGDLVESRFAQLQSDVAAIRTDIAEMRRREQLESFDRNLRRELFADWLLMLLQTTILLAALARGFNWL
jgi:hypothetical protein